jgi:putative heme transporter
MTEAAGKKEAGQGFAWRKVVRPLISVAVIAATFGFAVPKFASYSEVWPILAGLSIAQIVWLVVAQFLNSATYWLVYLAALPRLRFWQSAVLIQTNSAMASVLPAGGAFAVGITYRMLGSWGFSNASITELIGVSGIWNFGVKLTMPVASVLLLLATGVKSHPLAVAAAIGLAVCLVAGVLIGLVLWKEAIARALGRMADDVASWILRPFGKGPVTSLEPALVDIRRQTIDVARTRWLMLTWTSIASQLAGFLVFVLSMRFVGIPASQVSLVAVFAAFTFGMLAGSIPITPSGLGTADAVYIAVTAAAGASYSAAVAGDLVFRTLTYLLQIPVGGITYVIWRRKKSWLKPRGTGPLPAR